MKKKLVKILSLVLSIVTIFSVTMFASNAVDCSYGKYSTPSSSDYAYWNGKKMVKASGTTTSEIKWMQAALNYCIQKKYFTASYLTVDGSFGPASKATTTAFQKQAKLSQDGSFGKLTIAKMKDVLSDLSKKTTSTTSSKSTTSSSKISTSSIQAVLNKYGYSTGKYWTYKEGGNATSSYVATNRQGTQYSYKYNGVQCYGFANFVMHEVTGTNVNPSNGNSNGWKYIKASDVSELKIGDIVRIGKSSTDGHTGIVLTIDSNNGKCTFAQCFGGVNNKISVGTSLSSTKYGTHSTLSSMKSSGYFLYVYRYVG